MNDLFHKAGSEHVEQVADSNRRLLEKALYMRCQSYLAYVKSQLLTKTLYEIDRSKKDVMRVNRELQKSLETISRHKEVLDQEIQERKQIEQKLRESERRFQDFADTASDWFWELDAELRFKYVSQRFEGITGVAVEQVLGKTRTELALSPHNDDEAERFWKHQDELKKRLAFRNFEYAIRNADGGTKHILESGKPLFDRQGAFLGYRGASKDITERKEAEDKLRHLADHDALTGLPNLRMTKDRVTSALRRSHRNTTKTAILYLDLDGFKEINDSLGHDAGDELLIKVAKRLGACLRQTDTVGRIQTDDPREFDTVGRIGGDEFLIILPDIKDQRATSRVAKKLLQALVKPFEVHSQTVLIGACIGIALYPDHGNDTETMIKVADDTMYKVKRAEKNAYAFA